MRYLSTFIISLILIGCGRSNDVTTRYHEDGRAKPVIAVAPLLDTTSFDNPWSLSDEFTSMLARNISQNNQIFVSSGHEYSVKQNPFGTNLSWIKQEFHPNEFVVFLELVEHELVPIRKEKREAFPQEVAKNLKMSIRVRVIDLRDSQPKIVLQEMIRDSYYIPKTLIPTDYNEVSWGSEAYKKSSMGIAHSHISQEIANRISDYILLAKSR
jgi:hypothetical protein